MPQLCLYLQLHQPYRLKPLSVFDIGSQPADYFGQNEQNHVASQDNRAIFNKVAQKSYIPMLTLLNEILSTEPDFSCALSVSGVFLDQAQEFEPKVIRLLQDLAQTGRVEFLAETYYHSLSSLYSPREFRAQVKMQMDKIEELFGLRPRVLRNTELVYSNQIAELVVPLNFAGMLTEGVERYLHGRPRTQVYLSKTKRPLPLLLKHAQLSDDIAFRFSDRNWSEHPLSVDKYLEWVEVYPENEVVNLFMDFETFGEHQWVDTGIFEFFRLFIHRFLERPWNTCKTPTQLFFEFAQSRMELDRLERTYDVPEPISWADVDRDLTAWRDNALQTDTLEQIYQLEDRVLESGDEKLIEDWRKLQTSDHFYYMCIKWSNDGDVHAYFSPYNSPFEAYRMYSLALADLHERLVSTGTNQIEGNVWHAH